jgi:16S rRNA processing protein RimM
VADIFAIGRVVKPNGLKGGMTVVSYLESDEALHGMGEVFLRKESGREIAFRVRSISAKKKAFVLKVEGIEDAEAAGRWTGAEVLASSFMLKKLPAGEYYWKDIVGLRVVTEEGRHLGHIETIFPTGSNDVYVCTGGEREILLPAVEDVVRQIDVDNGTMVVRLYKGL